MEAEACPPSEESPGEPPPRDHWHVRISLIGLCLIFTDDSHSAPPPPPNTPTHQQTEKIPTSSSSFSSSFPKPNGRVVTRQSWQWPRCRREANGSETPLKCQRLPFGLLLYRATFFFVFLGEQLQNRLTPAGLCTAASLSKCFPDAFTGFITFSCTVNAVVERHRSDLTYYSSVSFLLIFFLLLWRNTKPTDSSWTLLTSVMLI